MLLNTYNSVVMMHLQFLAGNCAHTQKYTNLFLFNEFHITSIHTLPPYTLETKTNVESHAFTD